MDRPLGYSIEAARKQLGECSRAHLYRLVNRGQLKLVKVGGRSVITTESIEGLLQLASAEA